MDRQRFARLYPTDVARATKVLLVGCGGIGSYTASILARMGVGSITLVDFDIVEETNVATQDLEAEDIDKSKVIALSERLMRINRGETNVSECDTRFLPEHLERNHILVMAVDSIEARREIYKTFLLQNNQGQVLIDPRMGAESFELWVVRNGSEFQAEYERSLMDPTPRPELPCGARAIAYTGAFAGALTANAVKRVTMEPLYQTWVVGDVGAMSLQVLREEPRDSHVNPYKEHMNHAMEQMT